MIENASEQALATVNEVYRSESRRILATLIRLLGDFDLAEDALHDAFAAALERWPKEGVPASLTRADLSGEAIRLGRLLVELLPEPEVTGLLALLLLQESRRAARSSPAGDVILLEDQDRSLWNQAQITEGTALVERALSSRQFGPYSLQAAIAGVHAETSSPAATDWAQIVALYDVLARMEPSPVVELNRAVAVAMRDGPATGLELIDAILARGDLADYHLAHSARADLCRRLGRTAEARASYNRALALARQEPERRFLQKRLEELV